MFAKEFKSAFEANGLTYDHRLIDGGTAVRLEGVLLSLLGTAGPAVLHRWFDALADGGSVTDPLARKPWGATDGQVTDRHGLNWLIGYEPEE